MEVIYQNFDGLEVSFQCAVPRAVLKALEAAKKEAHGNRSPAYVEIGPNKLGVLVHETGARGGYTYQFSTGPDGAIWLVGDRDATDQWNVRVRVRSLCLALNGYEGTKQIILYTLNEDLMAKGPLSNDGLPKERVSRVDYCIDFLLMEEFTPSTNNFVCAGRTKKGTIAEIPLQQEMTGQRIEYVRIGKMPNRQIVIYDKLQEISAKSKKYWFRVWDLKKEEIKGKIWRIEIRAGKKELNMWNLRSFEDLEEMIGDVLISTLKNYKYTTPNPNDKNMTRWPMAEIWINAIKAVESDLFSYISNANRKLILKEMRDTVINRYEQLISGVFIGLTAAEGKDISEIPGVLDKVCDHVLAEIRKNPQKFIQKHKKKLEKFSELE